MSKLRDAVDDKAVPKESFWGWTTRVSTSIFGQGLGLFQMSYTYGKLIGWMVVTTGMITALPLIFEVKREGLIEEMEQAQIAQALNQGSTPRDLASTGLTSALEPAVLK